MPPEMPAPNPYAPSESSVIGNTFSYAHGHGQVPAEAVEALRQTRPWVLLLAILGSIATGLMVLGGVSIAIFSASSAGGATMIGMAFGYLIVALLYIYPILKLFRYSGAISRLVRSGSSADLVDALRHQKSFWRFIGIITCVLVVLYLLIIVFAAGSVILRR